MTYELAAGAEEAEHTFEAAVTPAGDYRFEWDFGDGSARQGTEGGSSTVSHIYRGTGTWYPKVTLYSADGVELGRDSITIILEKSGEPAPTQEPPYEPPGSFVTPAEREYAWVLVDTVPKDMQYDIDHTNKGGVYEVRASTSPGNYTYSCKYIGESDDYYDPPTIHGESYATLLTFSVPPTVIRGGETVSLSFSLVFTDTNLSSVHGKGSARADWDNLRFTNAGGKNVYEIFSSVYYSQKNVLSVSDTLSAVVPAGYSEGEQKKLWTGGYTGTDYVYEWRQIGTSAPVLNTEGIEGIVDIR